MSACCRWIQEACLGFWKLLAATTSHGSASEPAEATEPTPHPPLTTLSEREVAAAVPVDAGRPNAPAAGCRFLRTKLPDGGAARGCGEEKQHRHFYGRLKHCDSRGSVDGPLYRYVSSLSLELQAATSGSSFNAGPRPEGLASCFNGAGGLNGSFNGGGDCCWQERDTVASQLMDKLASRDVTGATRYCRLLLTLEPHNDEASRLLEALESADRSDLLLLGTGVDDLPYYAGDSHDEMDSENTDSETQFRYFHHDQHGLNEDERRSRRESSESDAFLDASSSSSD